MGQIDVLHPCTSCDAASHCEKYLRRPSNVPADCSKLVRPNMVSTTVRDVGRYSLNSTRVIKGSVPTFRWKTMRLAVWPLSGNVGKQEEWREATIRKRYEGPWRLWTSWRLSRNQSPFPASVTEVLKFLTEQFHTRKLSYRTVGAYKWCISQLHDPVDGQPLETLPLLSRFMKGILNFVR